MVHSLSLQHVAGPQTSCRGELLRAVLVTALAAPGDTLTMENQAVMLWGPIDPSTECADIDLRQQSIQHLAVRPICWVSSHQHLCKPEMWMDLK